MNRRTSLCISILIVIGIMMISVGISFAIFEYYKAGTKVNEMTTGTLVIIISEDLDSGINIDPAIPITDSMGLSLKPYKFTIKNKGTLPAKYQLSLINDTAIINEDGCQNNLVDLSNIKVSLKDETPRLLTDNNGILETGFIGSGESKDYTLKIWLDYDTTNEAMGKHYHGLIEVKAVQVDSDIL